MPIKQLKMPIFNDTFYSYSITLQGNRYILEFLFLERLGQWVLTLKDSESNVLVRNQRLTPDAPLFFDYKLPNLTGAFYLRPISSSAFLNEASNLRRPREFYELFYIFNDEI